MRSAPASGGIVGPLLFGVLISTGSRGSVAIGYAIGAALMLGAAAVEGVSGVAAERKSLETVAGLVVCRLIGIIIGI